MSTPEDREYDEMMALVNKIDEKIQEPGNEDVKASWIEGDYTACESWLKETFPEATTETWDHVEEFLSEM
jgi:uncharacterized protein YrzB (UPF0473 family)